MRTFKLTLSYDGTNYAGWQIQSNAPSIQALLERALSMIAGSKVRVVGSGRTDAGVHALAQVASCRLETRLTCEELLRAINGNLPIDIRVKEVRHAADDFHALRDAVRKSYRYVIQDGRVHDVFQRGYCWFVPGELDVGSMRRAGSYLTGRHDFASFQSAGSPRATTVRTVYELDISRRQGDQDCFIDFDISANGFLYNMVRNIVGTLVEVGRGANKPEWVPTVLRALNRQGAGPTAPSQGLFLMRVKYGTDL
jgi:tRNA pseudouridine38-40 synthase